MLQILYNFKAIRYSIAFFVLFLNTVYSQNTTLEFWPEVDVWCRLSPAWRASVFVPITSYHESKYRDINIYLHVDYSFGKTKRAFYQRMVNENRAMAMNAWMIRGIYMRGRSINKDKGNYSENMLFAELHKRIPVGEKSLFSQRIRTDFRWLGEDNIYSYRIRYRLMFEKEYNFEKISLVPFVNIEPYWDSRYGKFIRTRVILGAMLLKGTRFAYEGNLTYQYDETFERNNLFALNLILHVFFETKYKVKTNVH